jgi:hypothetical protein
VKVAVIVQVSFPEETRDNEPEQDDGPDGEPPPPPPPLTVVEGVNTLNAEPKNDAIELKNDEKKLVTSWNERA